MQKKNLSLRFHSGGTFSGRGSQQTVANSKKRCCVHSPVLAAMCNPLPHGGVEHVSAHVWVLTIRVEQPLQVGQPVLLRALSRHALQVVNDGGGQHLPWKQQRCRNNHLLLLWQFIYLLFYTYLCWSWYTHCTRYQGVHVQRIHLCLYPPHPLPHSLETPTLHMKT